MYFNRVYYYYTMNLVKASEYLIANKDCRPTSQFMKETFPFKASSFLAEVAAALLTDGHLELCKGTRPKKVIFYSDDFENIKWFNMTFKKIFGIEGKTVEYIPFSGFDQSSSSYKVVVNNAHISRLLYMIGIPGGDKTKKEFDIPLWIKTGTSEVKANFLQKLFDFDGSIPVKKNGRRSVWAIQFSTTKRNEYLSSGFQFCKSIQALLKEFDIDSRIYRHNKEDRSVLIINIGNQKSIVNYARHIGYGDLKKRKRMTEAVFNILENISFRNKEICEMLKAFKDHVGSDKETVRLLNIRLGSSYTNRQFEHWRRGEINVPLAVLKYLCGELRKNIVSITGLPKSILYLNEATNLEKTN